MHIFSCERSSTGFNDCFVVLVLGIIHPLVIVKYKSLFVLCCGTFCAFLCMLWYIVLGLVMGSNKGLKIYQTTNNFYLFYQANQQCVNMHTICNSNKTRPILNFTKKSKNLYFKIA
jgi:hypothetical protein